jgi:hypothetical protein
MRVAICAISSHFPRHILKICCESRLDQDRMTPTMSGADKKEKKNRDPLDTDIVVLGHSAAFDPVWKEKSLFDLGCCSCLTDWLTRREVPFPSLSSGLATNFAQGSTSISHRLTRFWIHRSAAQLWLV